MNLAAFSAELEACWLASPDGSLTAAISPWGGRLLGLWVDDRQAQPRNVVLGYSSLAGYQHDQPSMGALVGRWAGRLDGGRLQRLAPAWQLPINGPGLCVHGGSGGSRSRRFEVVGDEAAAQLHLRHRFLEDEDGFPGDVQLDMHLQAEAGARLRVFWQVQASGRDTAVNLTWHPFFNLAGDAKAQSLARHQLHVPAEFWLPCDPRNVPLGHCQPVDGSALDWRTTRPVAPALGLPLDHYLQVSPEPSANLRQMARLFSPDSGIGMEVFGQEPGLQIYGGHALARAASAGMAPQFEASAGLCLEPMFHPDAPNQAGFFFEPLQAGESRQGQWLYCFDASPA